MTEYGDPYTYRPTDGAKVTTLGEAIAAGWEWRPSDADPWMTNGAALYPYAVADAQRLIVEARPPQPKLIPVLLPEDIVRQAVTDRTTHPLVAKACQEALQEAEDG